MIKLEIAIQALTDIANPITMMERKLQPGEKLNGQMAIQLSNDPNFLKELARKALTEIAKD